MHFWHSHWVVGITTVYNLFPFLLMGDMHGVSKKEEEVRWVLGTSGRGQGVWWDLGKPGEVSNGPGQSHRALGRPGRVCGSCRSHGELSGVKEGCGEGSWGWETAQDVTAWHYINYSLLHHTPFSCQLLQLKITFCLFGCKLQSTAPCCTKWLPCIALLCWCRVELKQIYLTSHNQVTLNFEDNLCKSGHYQVIWTQLCEVMVFNFLIHACGKSSLPKTEF